ncbi:hypothetical protein [Hydrogenimonas sp.]
MNTKVHLCECESVDEKGCAQYVIEESLALPLFTSYLHGFSSVRSEVVFVIAHREF